MNLKAVSHPTNLKVIEMWTPTSPEVYAVIRAKHHTELVVFGTYSNPGGDDGMSIQPQMMTEWGFKDGNYPILKALTTWDKPIGDQKEWERPNEKLQYWICTGKCETE